VGNSLTWDAQPESVAATAANAGHTLTTGFHIRGNGSLPFILNNPTDISFTSSHGNWSDALDGHDWDAVTLQTFYGGTLASDVTAARTVMAEARKRPGNADTVYYLYNAYPGTPAAGRTYADGWLAPSENADGQATTLSRAYFSDLYARVAAAEPNAVVHTIPVGEVLYELEAAILRGELAGLSSASDLYRDGVHLNNVGRFAAAMTWYATLYGANPTGLPVIEQYWRASNNDWPTDETITPDLRDAIQGIAWDVVQADATTGVPEPASLSMLVVAGGLLLRRRHR
jgi:hypothetical protein